MGTSAISVLSTFTSDTVSLLAHQGGWDEILLVAGPIAVIVALLTVVKKRIDSSTSTNGSVDPLDSGTDSA